MAFFSDAEIESLSIRKMVFHMVGGADEIVRLQAMDPGAFEDFFLERIKSVQSGTAYSFEDQSETEQILRTIETDADSFQEQSELLAEKFHDQHTGATVQGAFLVFVLEAQSKTYLALLKYEHEEVLVYDIDQDGGDRLKVTMEAIEQTFVKNKNALQKSALIRLGEPSQGQLIVTDQQSKRGVARYFERFLGVERTFEDAELTKRLYKVATLSIRESSDVLPDAVVQAAPKRVYDAATTGSEIKGDNQKAFLEAAVGHQLDDDHPAVEKFYELLEKEGIAGMPVQPDLSDVKEPTLRKFKTQNGIVISVPIALDDRITQEGDKIIIHDTLVSQYVDAS